MKRTLVLLCILLFLWIVGSSYWYLCKINDHCNPTQIATEDKDPDERALIISEPASQNTEIKELETETETVQGTVIDSTAMVMGYMQKEQIRIIYFDYAKYETELTENDTEYLNMLRIYLENEPEKQVFLTGHSDSIGTPEGLIFASYQRVLFMTRVMVDAGIPEVRIQSKSLGEGFPAESNRTLAGRAKNRRVEITIRNINYHE